MKVSKQQPAKRLDKYGTVIMQLSLVLALFIVLQLLEYEKPYTNMVFNNVEKPYDFRFDYEPMVIVKKEAKVEKLKKIHKPIILDEITTVIDAKTQSDIILLDDPMVDEIAVVLKNVVEEAEDITPEFFHFDMIIDAPVFKGCEGLSKGENKKCFARKIQQFVISRFDIDLAQELGLRSGKHRMYVQFMISKNGDVVNIKIKAPHKRLKKEVKKIISKLPKFIPGKQLSKPVKVKFTLPVTFSVE